MITSKRDISLYDALKENIAAYFDATGKSRYADQLYWSKIILFTLIPLFGYYILLAFGATSLWTVVAGYFLFNMGSTLVIVNVAHDASHRALSKNESVNRILSFSWNLIGMSRYLWEMQHHQSHHIHTAIPHRDLDVEENFWFRNNLTYAYRPHYRFQHLYAPLVYLMFGIFFIYIKDFVMFFSGKLKPFGANRLPSHFLILLVLTKLFYVTVSLLIPILALPYAWWQVLMIYLLSLSVSIGFMSIVLVLPHNNEFAVLHESRNGMKRRDDWIVHQVQCSIDSSADSRWFNWFLGGLNTHLVHHLFPNICHIHYPQLSRIIMETLHNHGIPYIERSFGQGITDHFRFLKRMGMKPVE